MVTRKGARRLFNWLTRFFRRKHRIHSPIRVAAGVKAGVTRKRRERFDAALSEVERYLHVSRYRVDKKALGRFSGLHHARQQDFNHAEPWLLAQELPEFYPDHGLINMGVSPNQLVRPLDVRVLANWADESPEQNKLSNKAVLQRVRRVYPNNVRGRVEMYMPYMVEWRAAFIDPIKNHAEPWVLYAGTSDFVHWFNISSGLKSGPLDEYQADELTPKILMIDRLNFFFGIAESRQDKWLVSIEQEDSASLLLPTDPVGVREMFRFRDLPDGRKRRASLLHWVEDHYRQYNDDPAALTYVRKHLRGKTLFHWNGLRCRVRPPILASEFSRRSDLVAIRDEAQGSIPATIPVESLRLKSTEEIAMDDIEAREQINDLREGRRQMVPANKIGTWVTLGATITPHVPHKKARRLEQKGMHKDRIPYRGRL